MTYPPHGHQPQPPQDGRPPQPQSGPQQPGLPPYQPPVEDQRAANNMSKAVLNLSGAALAWVIIGVLAFCVGGPILMCLFCGFGSVIGIATTPTPTP